MYINLSILILIFLVFQVFVLTLKELIKTCARIWKSYASVVGVNEFGAVRG